MKIGAVIIGTCTAAVALFLSAPAARATDAAAVAPAEIVDPWNDDYIPIHPDRDPDLYRAVFDPPQPGECPAVVVIAARGSEQNTQIRPTRYSPEAPWTSNGFEEKVFKYLFRQLEAEHLRSTGESLMKDVYVMGLTDREYPASFPLRSPGSSAIEFPVSVSSGRASVVDAADRFEDSTGCTPKYLLAGYSQGTLVVGDQAQDFIDRDQYVGTFLLANPAQYPGDPSIVGAEPISSGLTSSLGLPRNRDEHTISYCRIGDIVCDSSPGQFLVAGSTALSSAVIPARSNSGSSHTLYFTEDDRYDKEVLDALAGWIVQARES